MALFLMVGILVTDWTILALKEYIERRFDDQGLAIKLAMDAAEKAVTKAEVATEKRFDSVNEFRRTLSDQAATFLQRGEYNAEHRSLINRVDTLSKTQNMLIGGLILMSFIEPILIAVIVRWSGK